MPYLGYGHYEGASSNNWNKIFKEFYRCPSDKRDNSAWSYGKNVWFELSDSETGAVFGKSSGPTYWKTSRVPHPSSTIQFGELGQSIVMSAADHFMAHFWLIGGEPEIDTQRHKKVSTYVYVDGHVETLPIEKTFCLDKKIDDWNPATAK